MTSNISLSLDYLQEELPLLAQAIAVGMREDMKQNPIRFALDFTVVGDLISIVEYIQGFDMMSEIEKYVRGSVIGLGLAIGTSKSGDDAFKKVVKDFYTVDDYLKLVNRDTIITHGMSKPQTHYRKHGVKEFLECGLEPISAQQYFDDAKLFRQLNKDNVLLKTSVNIRENNVPGWKIVDSTGKGGYYYQDGAPVTFFYFPNQ